MHTIAQARQKPSIQKISHAVHTSSHVTTGPLILNVESSVRWPEGKEASSSQVVTFQCTAEAKFEENNAANMATEAAKKEQGRNTASTMFEIDQLSGEVLLRIIGAQVDSAIVS